MNYRAENEVFIVPGEGPYEGHLLFESAYNYKCTMLNGCSNMVSRRDCCASLTSFPKNKNLDNQEQWLQLLPNVFIM